MQTKCKQQPTLAELSDKIDRLEAITLIGAKNVLDIDEAALFTGYSKSPIQNDIGAADTSLQERPQTVLP